MTSLAVLNNIASEEELGSGWKEISELMDSVEQTLNQYATAASVKAVAKGIMLLHARKHDITPRTHRPCLPMLQWLRLRLRRRC